MNFMKIWKSFFLAGYVEKLPGAQGDKETKTSKCHSSNDTVWAQVVQINNMALGRQTNASPRTGVVRF